MSDLPARILATSEAEAVMATLAQVHGPLMFHQSGGCCDGSAPMCYPRGEFRVGGQDVFLGHVAGDIPVWIGAAQFEFAVLAVAGVAAVEIDHIIVEPVAVGLDQAFEGDFRTADHVDGDFGVGGRHVQRSDHGGSQEVVMQFHGRSLAGRWEDARRLEGEDCVNVTIRAQAPPATGPVAAGPAYEADGM